MQEVILIVDDDIEIIELMRDFLEMEGYAVLTAENGEAAMRIMNQNRVDCVLLDVMMPGESGFTICRAIREHSDVPVLFLSAREESTDKIRGLGVGGDDYIVKSATPGEIIARIKAVRRRFGKEEFTSLTIGLFKGLSINYSAREVEVNSEKVTLTTKEFDLLALLAKHRNQVFTHDQIIDRIWGEHYGDQHSVRVFIARIRDKIERGSTGHEYIQTVWGTGYKFTGEPLS